MLQQRGHCGIDVFSYSYRSARTSVARTKVVGCSRDRNRTMVLRELHADEGKLPIPRVDTRDESLMRHELLSSQSLKDSCWKARKNSRCGNSRWQQLADF